MTIKQVLNNLSRRTIAKDLVLWLSLSISILVVSLGSFLYFFSTSHGQKELRHRASYITEELANVLAVPLWGFETETIQQISKSNLRSEELVGLKIEANTGEVLFEKTPKVLTNLIKFEKMIFMGKEQVGKLSVFFSDQRILRTQKTMVYIITIISLSTLVIIIIGTNIIMSLLFKKPLNQFIKNIRVIAQGEYQTVLLPLPQKDINEIGSEVNMMVQEIAKREEALAISEKKYRQIFEDAFEGIFQVTTEGQFISANQSMARILGYNSPNELLNSGTNIFKECIEPPQDAKKIYDLLVTRERISDLEIQGRQKDKSLFWVLVSARLVRNIYNKIVYYEGSIVDITEKKEKKKAERDRKAAEVSSQAKSEFLANMSHEIRTPMNAILGFANLLKDHVDGRQPKQFLNAISSSGKNLMSIIDGILDLSKIEAGKLEITTNKMKPREIIYDMQQIFSQLAVEKSVDFFIGIYPDIPEYLILDEVRLRQILLNLCGNAVKFVDNGFVKLSMKMQKNAEKSDLIITVQDTGIGIAKDQKELIFESFQQQKGQSSQKYGGTGLGLSITKHLIEMMGGEISVESEVGKGSIFTVTLKDVEIGFGDVINKAEEIDIDSVLFEKATLLVVDDLEENRLLMSEYLSTMSLSVIEAENGLDAIGKTRQYQPALILMDMKMPVMDGFTATKQLKNDQKLKTIPVIAVSGDIMFNEEGNAKQAGCDMVLRKPISRKDIIKALMQFLPYSSSNTETKESASEEVIDVSVLSDETKEKIPEIIKELEYRMTEMVTIKTLFAQSTAGEIIEKIRKTGTEHNLDFLIKWADEIKISVDSFDIESVEKQIDLFPKLIQKISVNNTHSA